MRSILNLWLLPREARSRVAILIDTHTGVTPAEYLDLLHPWRSWLTVNAVLALTEPVAADGLEDWAPANCQAVVIVSERNDFVSAAQRECRTLHLPSVTSGYPPQGTRAAAMQAEVAHHDYETGGLNEWDGTPAQFSRFALQHLSPVHCFRLFPNYALEDIRRLHQEQRGNPLVAVDIGCGPISRLRWGALQGLLTVTGVDPLLEMYQVILQRHGIASLPKISCDRELSILAEELTRFVAPGSVDFVFTNNALDHVEDPGIVVEQVATCLRTGGIFALACNTREGTAQKWSQMHQFDIYLDKAGQLLCETQDGKVRQLVPPTLILRQVVASTKETTAVILERR
jgi:SAM-dependent methyltransferase